MKIDKFKIQDELRNIESNLEEIGRKICDVKGGTQSWYDINRSLSDLREAIRDCHFIEN